MSYLLLDAGSPASPDLARLTKRLAEDWEE